MNGLFTRAAAVVCLFFAMAGFAQVINATLSGTVSDATGALIPGVEITATETETGVVSTTLTNEAGTYQFPSLQPGPYRVNASLAGFQSQIFQITLGTSQQIRQNFTLQVGTVAQSVEVSVAADQLLTTQSASVGNALAQRAVADLPIVGRNVMDIATTIMPGVFGDGHPNTTFAGITATGGGNIGISMDGVTMNTGTHVQGLKTATFINPDMVDEVRVVVAAVDVEGRGSAQIQVRTRSGTNQFHGGATLNIRNSAFDANTWMNNRQHVAPLWYNRPQYTASLGGPIIKNKTFFFGMFDAQDGSQKQIIDTVVLTDPARQGIFRFFPGVNNGNADATPSGSPATRVASVVDKAGNPRPYTQIPGATGPMQSFSVFGDALNPGDSVRRQMDPSGFMSRLLALMPHANAFDGPSTNGLTSMNTPVSVDGLNTAIHRWTRRTVAGPAGGTGENVDAYRRRQFNIKIDHHFNQNHTLTGTFIRESHYTDNNLVQLWPTGWGGDIYEYPKVMTAQLTSTLSPTLLNEFKWGRRVTALYWDPAFQSPAPHAKDAFDFLTKINGIPIHQLPVLFPNHVINNSYTGTGCPPICVNSDLGNNAPLSSFTETLTWTKGSHAFKGGVEFRFGSSKGWAAGGLMPIVTGGPGAIPVTGIDKVPGLLSPNQTLAQNLLLTLAGSVDTISEKFETREPTDTQYVDYRQTYNGPHQPPQTYGRVRKTIQNEFNFFVKDDWKITPNFTLNLGLRWDLFQVPYFESLSGKNFTYGLTGGSSAAFGYSGRSFNNWMSGGTPQKADLTQIVLIGRGSPYPHQGLWPSDKHNFAPAVGFAWSPNWAGKDKTTVRGGYQIAYQLPGNTLSWIGADTGNTPGSVYQPIDRGTGAYRDYSSLTIPLPVTIQPVSPTIFPITDRSQVLSVFAPDYTTPYVETFTLGITRALTSTLTLDVRYLGDRGLKLHSTLNLNEPDFRNNGLLQALAITRAGGNAPVFDQMFKGLNLGNGVVGTDVSGSDALRGNSSFRSFIANGDFASVARALNTTNVGTVQPKGQVINGGTLRSSGLFPENFIVANPQFSTVNYRNNSDSSNYHSLEAAFTVRPTHGIAYRATYTWSRSLAVSGGVNSGGGFNGTYRDLLNRRADYTLQPTHRAHDFRSYGTFQLPFGPGRLLGANTSGWFARLIEGWDIGTIVNLTSGDPLLVLGGTTISGLTTYVGAQTINGVCSIAVTTCQQTITNVGIPDIVGAFPRNGKVVWPLQKGNAFGNFFSQQYQRVQDPACAAVAAAISQFCTLTALADANGKIVLRNAAPGQLGSLGLNPLTGPGTWSFDANILKTVKIAESKTLTLRVDAHNVFNHPTPSDPNLNINLGTFGEINSKSGNRTLQGQIHFQF
jgi:hypothetical protein